MNGDDPCSSFFWLLIYIALGCFVPISIPFTLTIWVALFYYKNRTPKKEPIKTPEELAVEAESMAQYRARLGARFDAVGRVIKIIAIVTVPLIWFPMVLDKVYKFISPIVYESLMKVSYYSGKLYAKCKGN